MTVDFMIRLDAFDGGDWGIRDPSQADGNMFSGENMTVYPSGLLGPRAGIKRLPVDGLPDHPVVPGPMGFTPFNAGLVITLGTRNYRVPMTGGTATAWAPYPSLVITPVRWAVGNGNLYSLVAGVLYRHDGATATTAITTPVPLSDIVRWQYWFVGVDRNKPWRIWFSKVDDSGSDFDTWPDLNYIDVGNNDPITCLQPIYNTLYAGKKEGWWAISGDLERLASQREVVIGNGPIDCRTTSLTTDNRVIYWPVQHIPAWFNGERVNLEYEQVMLQRGLGAPGEMVIVTPTARRLILAGDDEAGGTKLWVWQQQSWEHHRVAAELGALAPGDVRQGSDMPNNVVYAAARPTTIGEPTVIVTVNHEMNRPAHADDSYAAPIDAISGTDLVAGYFSPPAWYDGQGRLVRVRWVQVHFRKWPSGIGESLNRIVLRVEALGPYGAGSEMSDPVRWAEPSARAPRDGVDESWRTNVGEQGWANGFRLWFDAVAGVAIRNIVVGVNLRTERQ